MESQDAAIDQQSAPASRVSFEQIKQLPQIPVMLSALLLGQLLQTVVLLLLFWHAPPPEPKWEYMVTAVPDLTFESQSSQLGAAGWELVTARRAQGSDEKMCYEMVFKRRTGERKAPGQSK